MKKIIVDYNASSQNFHFFYKRLNLFKKSLYIMFQVLSV